MKRSTELFEFFVLAFLITWFFWIPLALQNKGLIPFQIPQVFFLIGAFGPALSAVIITIKYLGRKGIKGLFRKFLIIKVHIKWYLASLLLPWIIVLSVLLFLLLIHGPVPGLEFKDAGSLAGIFFASLIVCANEEISWRGFALPKLQKKHNALLSSLILGFFWGLIHFPLFLIQPERSGGFSLLITAPGFVFMTVLLSIIYTTLYNNTKGSVILATLFHTSLNTANELYSSPATVYDLTAMILFVGTVFVISIVLIGKYGWKDLASNPRIMH